MNTAEFSSLSDWLMYALEDGLILDKRDDRGVSITAFSPEILDLMGFTLERDGALSLYFQEPEWAWIKGFQRYSLESGKGIFLFTSAPLTSKRLELDTALFLPLSERAVRGQDWQRVIENENLSIVKMKGIGQGSEERHHLRPPKILSISDLYRRLGGADLPLLFVDHMILRK